MSNVVLRTFSYTINWDSGTFFPKIKKWLTHTIMDKKVTFSNSPLKLSKERKYVIDLIPVKNYKKGFVFLVETTLKDVTNYSLKLAKMVL